MSSDHTLKPPGTLPEQVTPRPAGGPEYCPHLAMVDDPDTHLLYPDGVHVCRARGQARPIDLEHQKRYCLSSLHRDCRRYVPPSAPRGLPQRQLVAYEGEWLDAEALKPAPRPISFWRVLGWALLGSAFILVAIYLAGRILTPTQTVVREVGQLPTRTLTPSPTRATTPAPSEAVTPTAPALAIVAHTPTPTPPPGGANYVLSPAAGAVGWVVSSEDRGNHFGDSNIYSGAFEGRVYHGALQFDVSTIPRGAPIYAATLQLVGLNRERLGTPGTWEVRILTDTLDFQWSALTYQDIHNAAVIQSLSPILSSDDLDVQKVNQFSFTPTQLQLLQQRILNEGRLSLRIDGPLVGSKALFSWDSGYGPTSRGVKPILFVSAGPPPATPPPREYVVVTNTPTPENLLTAAAIVARATLEATTTGTPTPTPYNLVTATPADWVVVTATPTPANTATLAFIDRVATAMAMTTGTPTPVGENVVTATPTPTWIIVTPVPTAANAETAVARLATAEAEIRLYGIPTPLPPNWVTPIVVVPPPPPLNAATATFQAVQATAQALLVGTATPTPPNVWTATPTPTWVIITPEPTPVNAETAMARANEAIARAQRLGPPTPLPPNWVTPIVVTATPTPENEATASSLAVRATANALVYGTATATPPNVWTATPTPLVLTDVATDPTPTLPPTPVPTPDPHAIPPEMYGRIVFVSDREGGRPAYYIMDPDGSNVQRLSGTGVYSASLVRDTLDPTGQFQAFVSVPRSAPQGHTEISLRRLTDGYEWFVAGGNGANYDPAYCQADPRYVAFTSQQTGNDEIFVVDLNSNPEPGEPLSTVRLTENEWEWDKHPSFSPDCKQIVFWSNRSGSKQIWVMDFWGIGFAGQNLRNISNNTYNDWDPVWIKPPPNR